MGSVERLSGVSGLGPSTVPIAFLRGKLSNVISPHSDGGPPKATKDLLCWPLLTLASSPVPREERPTSEVPNYNDATAEDAPAHNRCLCP